jgi:hypothetical protein
MASPTRDEALATLEEGNAALTALFARLTDDQMSRPATIGGGDWSAKDLLGHVAFWEELAAEAIDTVRAGRTPRAESIFGSNGVDAANAEDQKRTLEQPLAETQSRALAAHRAVVAGIESMSDAEWVAKVASAGSRRETVAALLGSILGAPKRPFGHAFAHLADLEAYVDSLTTR